LKYISKFYPFKLADKYSLFILAIFSKEIPLDTLLRMLSIGTVPKSFGIHLRYHVQHDPASILPCGNKAYWDTLAEASQKSFTRRYTSSQTNTSCCIKGSISIVFRVGIAFASVVS
jgi:hypothetical protein